MIAVDRTVSPWQYAAYDKQGRLLIRTGCQSLAWHVHLIAERRINTHAQPRATTRK